MSDDQNQGPTDLRKWLVGKVKTAPRRPITASLLYELIQLGDDGVPLLDSVVRRLVNLALTAPPTQAIEAIRLMAAYVDGLPTQIIEVDVFEAARAEAERRGLDPQRVISILESVRQKRA
jgi:hypothetical protein